MKTKLLLHILSSVYCYCYLILFHITTLYISNFRTRSLFHVIFFALYFPHRGSAHAKTSSRFIHFLLNFNNNPLTYLSKYIVTLRSRNLLTNLDLVSSDNANDEARLGGVFRRKVIENLSATPAETPVDIIALKKKKKI